MNQPNTESKVDTVRRQVATAIRSARAARRLSQIEVAKQAGVSPSRVSELENEISDPQLSTLVKIADELGLSVSVTEAAA